MTGEIIIAAWTKNSRETLQVRLDTFKGQAIVDCRAWYAGRDGILKPGRGGLTISTRHLPQLADALGKALAMVTADTGIDLAMVTADTGIDVAADDPAGK